MEEPWWHCPLGFDDGQILRPVERFFATLTNDHRYRCARVCLVGHALKWTKFDTSYNPVDFTVFAVQYAWRACRSWCHIWDGNLSNRKPSCSTETLNYDDTVSVLMISHPARTIAELQALGKAQTAGLSFNDGAGDCVRLRLPWTAVFFL